MLINEIVEVLPSVPTPTVGDIARKHGVSEQQIRSQLKKGIRVEYEHSKDRKIATEIALDHLNELPDYYTRLQDMEGQVTEDISLGDIDAVNRAADKLFRRVGIDVRFTKHFMDRVNDTRNGKPITVAELIRLFRQEYRRWGKPIARLGPDAEGTLKDLQTDINVPFVLVWDATNQELDMVAKTIMRKKDFRTHNTEFPVGQVQEAFKSDSTGLPDPDEILFNPSKADYFRDWKKWEGEVVYMSPDEYIRKCKEGFLRIGEYGDIMAGRDVARARKYAEMMRNGEKFDMPILDYRRDWFSQEGIHRAWAAQLLDLEEIPVGVLRDVKS
jgi:hypothetical protein